MGAKEQLFELVQRAMRQGTLRKLVFSKPTGEVSRLTGRLSTRRGETILACEETLSGGKVKHSAHTINEVEAFLLSHLAAFRQVNLLTGAGDCEYRASQNGKEVLLGGDKLLRALRGESDFTCYITSLDRKKEHILQGDEPFLIYLGVSDKNGRVHDKKQAKYRQINRYLEHVGEIYDALPETGKLTVYDLCCGKSYLSFAVYYYLTAIRGREVDMLCMDLKEDVIDYCASVASAVGFGGMRFIAGDIRLTPRGVTPDLVISLHACDIATDIVLDTAIELGAKVILSTPCCHRYLSDRVEMEALSFVTKHPYLKGKLCEIITEGIRLARLEANGYRVTALEMTDPDDTPKNTLLRAVKLAHFDKDSKEAKEKSTAYFALLAQIMGDSAKDYLKEIKL